MMISLYFHSDRFSCIWFIIKWEMNLFIPDIFHLMGRSFPWCCPGVRRGRFSGRWKSAFMSVRGCVLLSFILPLVPPCRVNRMDLFCLFWSYSGLLLDERLRVPCLSCGSTRGFGPPPLNGAFIWFLPKLFISHASEPCLCLWLTAALEAALGLLGSVPPKTPKCWLPLHYTSVWKWTFGTWCQELGQAALHSQVAQCFFLFT